MGIFVRVQLYVKDPGCRGMDVLGLCGTGGNHMVVMSQSRQAKTQACTMTRYRCTCQQLGIAGDYLRSFEASIRAVMQMATSCERQI